MQRQNTKGYIWRVVFSYFGEHISRAASEGEQNIESMKHGNSKGKPPRNSRDTQVLLCTLGGIIIGCVMGVVIGTTTMDTGGAVMGSIFGFIIGGIIGSFVGEYLKRRKYRKLDRLANKETDHKQEPFIN